MTSSLHVARVLARRPSFLTLFAAAVVLVLLAFAIAPGLIATSDPIARRRIGFHRRSPTRSARTRAGATSSAASSSAP
jgi:hypothetical protein